jgi:hypothetical protein
MGLGMMICFRLNVETIIIPFRLIPIFLCFNLVQSPIIIYFLLYPTFPSTNYLQQENFCLKIAIESQNEDLLSDRLKNIPEVSANINKLFMLL